MLVQSKWYLQTYTELVRLVCVELLNSSLIVIKLEPSSSFAFILKPTKTYIRKVLGTYDHMPGKRDSGWLSHLLPLQGLPLPSVIRGLAMSKIDQSLLFFYLLNYQSTNWERCQPSVWSRGTTAEKVEFHFRWAYLPFNYCTLNCVLCLVMYSWDWPAVKDCKACRKWSHASPEILGF